MGKLLSDLGSVNIKDYKLAFFDIDGTIFKSDYSISEKTISYIKKLKTSGIITSLATGRPYFGCKEIIKSLGIRDASMFSSGGIVIMPEKNEVIFQESLKFESLSPLLNDLKLSETFIELYSHDNYYVEFINEISEIHSKYLHQPPIITNFEKAITEMPLNKIVAIAYSQDQKSALKEIAKRYPDYSFAFSYGASHPDITFLNITSSSADRKKVFDFILNFYNLSPSQVMSFGDSDADVTFLENSGLGVAVGNASQAAKDAAKIITSSVEEDGVVQLLQAMGI